MIVINSHTIGDQTFIGNRVVARDHLSIKSEAGKVTRFTEKHTHISQDGNVYTEEEYLGPTQQFISEQSNVLISGPQGIHETSAQTFALGDVIRESAHGDILLEGHDLKKTVRKKETKRRGLFRKKSEKVTTETTYTHAPNQTFAGGSSILRHQNPNASTTLIGAREQVGEDIIFDGGRPNVQAAGSMNVTDIHETQRKTFSSSSRHDHTETPVITPALLMAARNIHFTNNTSSARLAGVHVSAQKFTNETREGMLVEPVVALFRYLSNQKSGNAIAGATIKIDVGKEIMCQHRLKNLI